MDELDIVIEKAKKLEHVVEVVSIIKSGKEATVYRAVLDGILVAMKVYKDPEERSFRNTGEYLQGKYYRKASEREAMAKNNKFAKKTKHENWVKREFFMLQKLFIAGAHIPEPILQVDNVIFMQLLGDEELAAPRLCDVELTEEEAKDAFRSIIGDVKLFWTHGIVHADLSAYNILWWQSTPFIIDFPQSIDRKTHPTPNEVLQRDLKNIAYHFKQYFVVDVDFILSSITLKYE